MHAQSSAVPGLACPPPPRIQPRRWIVLLLLTWMGGAWAPIAGGATNLVVNGSFEQARLRAGAPDDWSSAGNPAVRQELRLDTGRDGHACARLECTEFNGDGPDFHAMVCQVGKVGVRAGHWYRLTFWARARGIPGGALEVALSNTRPWENAGLADACSVPGRWERFDFLFRAKTDLPAATSRLQFWFKGTGTLWLDDVELTESTEGQQWFPQLATEGLTNFVPNSSFECGTAQWGSFTWGLGGWAGNLYRLEGELDTTAAPHGRHALKIALTPATLPVFWFDYYEPVRQPVRRVLVAHHGWFRVRPGEPLTLSAFLRAEADGTIAQLAVNEAPSRLAHKAVTVGREWQRHAFTFTPTQPFLFIAVGLDLEATARDAATLWVDAIQLERGERAQSYQPRQPVEAFVDSDAPGNLFTDVARGASWFLHAFNDTSAETTVAGHLTARDFFDQLTWTGSTSLRVPAHTDLRRPVGPAQGDRRGFSRVEWISGSITQSVRGAVIEPLTSAMTDSPFGFNHAYPWDFLVQLARQAGVAWWRDWSAKWQTVEPRPGRFEFAVADAQIQRVLRLDSNVEVLLPFPSASWSTTARAEEIAQAAGQDTYLRTRLPLACAPKNLDDFGRYAAAVVRHYGATHPGRTPDEPASALPAPPMRPVTHYQVLNEPVYTDYALPQKFGYTLDDYLRLLEAAARAMKTADPSCRIVGGISANLDAGFTREFVTRGGLQFVDVFDLHMYDPARPAESFENSFRTLEDAMRAHGGPKPVWITEWGCYADDDPACIPQTVGDATMNRCRWASERAATEHIVKFAAVAFAHGVRKIFFHAGTCGAINGPDAGGVLFEYGGAPRKMLAGVAAFTRRVGVPDELVRRIRTDSVEASVFRARQRIVAVAWCPTDTLHTLTLPSGVSAYDIMGNALPPLRLDLAGTPVYLEASNAEPILDLLQERRR